MFPSLKPTTVSKETIMENVDKEVYVEKHEEEEVLVIEEPLQPFTDDFILVSPNISITVPTENGYFKSSNKNLKIVKRTSSQVVFSIPFGLPEVEIEIKEKGDIIIKKYRVV